MEQMETVLSRLSEIEDAAVSLEEQAAEQKKDIAAEYDAKTDAENELLKMKLETERELTAMEQEYSQNHEKLAEGIFHKMIGE